MFLLIHLISLPLSFIDFFVHMDIQNPFITKIVTAGFFDINTN